MDNKVKAASYVRVSTLLGQDPTNQTTPITEFAEGRGFEIVNEYADIGISGAKERRPGLDQMVKDARMGKFKVIIVIGIDRIARDVRHLLNLIEELNHYGVSLISLRENMDFTTPMGRAALAILGTVAGLERELIRERIKTALAAKKLLAERTGSGWRCGRPSAMTPEIEKQIMRLHEAGGSVRSIAKKVGIGKTSVNRFINRVSAKGEKL
jgi:DNA invertase Pin-like site-specific DNA recombinase